MFGVLYDGCLFQALTVIARLEPLSRFLELFDSLLLRGGKTVFFICLFYVQELSHSIQFSVLSYL